MIDATDAALCYWLAQLTGRASLPYVFVDRRPVGRLGEIRALERSGDLEHMVRGEV